MSPWLIALLVAALHVCVCTSSEALRASRWRRTGSHQEQAAYLDQLEDLLGSDQRRATESRLAGITKELQTTFASLPKNGSEVVSAPAARYALHRLFVKRHGWHIKGLSPVQELQSPLALALGVGVGDQVPKQQLLDLVEDRLESNGFHLHELALLASTIETLAHGEVNERLSVAYKSLKMESSGRISKNNAVRLMETYMTAFLTGQNISQWERASAEQLREDMKSQYSYWTYFETLLHDSLREVFPLKREFSFSDISGVLELVSERIGRRVEEGNCQDIEARLIQIEEASGSGRVRLHDFYSSYLNSGSWQFQESIEYMRNLGVLDESDPVETRVIIPNYRNTHSSCLNVSSFYSLCCVDACESLLEHVESKIQAPHATPQTIIDIVSALPSAHVPGNRMLSRALVTKLHEVAEHHGGWVTLHGRLFAQWMHFAYPRDCPYPHRSGAATPLTGSEWFEETGTDTSISLAGMQSFIESTSSTSVSTTSDEEEELCSAEMWVPEERLLDAGHAQMTPLPAAAKVVPTKFSSIRKALLPVVFVAAIVSSAAGMRNVASQAAAALKATHTMETWSQQFGLHKHTS